MTTEIRDFLISQLDFYAAVSFDRNYLWKQEIIKDNNFPQKYLFINMWNPKMPDSKINKILKQKLH